MSKYTYTDAAPVRAHISTLIGTGWSRRAIANATHGAISDQGVNLIAAGRTHRVRDITADAILAIDPQHLPTTSYRGAEPYVPKYRAVRRIHALLAIGWTHRLMTEHCGVHTAAFLHKCTAGLCLISTHNQIAAMYRQLATRPGPSEITRLRARALGHPSPADWEDIDHDEAPEHDTAHPVPTPRTDIDPVVVERILAGDHVPASDAERRQVVALWPTTGRPLRDLARLTGWKVERYHQTTEDAA